MSERKLNFEPTYPTNTPTESQTMTEIVLLHHNEPMTTSLAIAGGVEMEHNSVMILMKKHIESLSEFGRVQFEIEPFETNGGLQVRDVAFLNEQQATLLITFMRNSPIVIKFKIALVKAFFELRDRAASQQIPQPSAQLFLSHTADIIVAADRTFRAGVRSGRLAGLSTAQSIRRANQLAYLKTGINLIEELKATDHLADMESKEAQTRPEVQDKGGLQDFWGELENDGFQGVGYNPWLSTSLHQLYLYWCLRTNTVALNLPRMVHGLKAAGFVRGIRKRFMDAYGGEHGPSGFLFPVGPNDIPEGVSESQWLGQCVAKMDEALNSLNA